jgi:rubrerythrin
MAALTENKNIKTVLLDIAGEERHVGEFQVLLLAFDQQQEKELTESKKEVGEVTDKIFARQ